MRKGSGRMKQLLNQEKGLTLVELLVALALTGIVSIVIINLFAGGLRSYNVTSTQTELHNDANYVMTLFTNEIYKADTVEELGGTGREIILNEGSDKEVKLGFDEDKAYIERNGLRNNNLSTFDFLPESKFEIKCFDEKMANTLCDTAVNKSVQINLAIQDKEKDLELKLESEVPIALGHRIIEGGE